MTMRIAFCISTNWQHRRTCFTNFAARIKTSKFFVCLLNTVSINKTLLSYYCFVSDRSQRVGWNFCSSPFSACQAAAISWNQKRGHKHHKLPAPTHKAGAKLEGAESAGPTQAGASPPAAAPRRAAPREPSLSSSASCRRAPQSGGVLELCPGNTLRQFVAGTSPLASSVHHLEFSHE